MDGITLRRRLSFILNEDLSTSGFLSARTSYEYLYEAAIEFVRRTRWMTTTQSITTVADQSAYTIDSDFLDLYLMEDYNQYFVKYNDGSTNTFLFRKHKGETIYEDSTTSVSLPSGFYIDDDTLSTTSASGTTTSAGTATAGECTLTDSGASFGSNAVNPGDTVHNTTDGSTGYVLSVTSGTAVVTALFGGTNNEWGSGDSYRINYQPRFQFNLTPPPSTAGHTVTLYYIQKPDPVFSDYGRYRFPVEYTSALVKYAAFLYKYSDSSPDYGDKWYQYWDMQMRKFNRQLNASRKDRNIRVNMIRRD